MTAEEFVEMLAEALYSNEEAQEAGVDTRTYAEVGMMTSNAGLVARVGDQEFQVTVVAAR